MTQPIVRRLDHVAVVVSDTESALTFYRDKLGLRVVASEENERVSVRLTYLDMGNAYLQLVEPFDRDSAIGAWLAKNGEGLHHVCFGADDVAGAVSALSGSNVAPPPQSGRGRPSGFIAADSCPHNVIVEFTQFDHDADVAGTPGWIAGK